MIYESSLKHHGILGMKWGVRRYQPYPAGHVGGKEIGEAARSRKEQKKTVIKGAVKTISGIASGAAFVSMQKGMKPFAMKTLKQILPNMTVSKREVISAAISSIAALSSSIIVNASCTKIGNKIVNRYLEETVV